MPGVSGDDFRGRLGVSFVMATTSLQSVLVTGASGFIGKRLVRRLIERCSRVACLVRADSFVDSLQFAGVQLVTGDVTDRDSLKRALTQSQAGTVFHLAGLVKALHGQDFTTVNAGGVANIAAACAAQAQPPVLVVVSSLSAAGPNTTDQLRVESDVPVPVSRYGRSKLAGEQVAAEYARVVPITIVRPPIVFGPGDRGVLEILRPIARRSLHIVPGWDDRRFSLVHVDDLVEGLLLAAAHGERLDAYESSHPTPGSPGSPGNSGDSGTSGTSGGGRGIYFIASDEHPTYAQFGQALAIALGQKSPTIIHLPGPLLRLIGIGGDLMTRIRHSPQWINSDKITEALAGSWACSAAKARTQLDWSPAASLAERLHETVQWYRHAQWL